MTALKILSGISSSIINNEIPVESIFLNSAPRVLYDPSDLTSLYRQSSGGILQGNISADGDEVGIMLDKSRMRGATAAAFIAAGPELYTGGAAAGTPGYEIKSGETWEIWADGAGSGAVTILANAPAFSWFEVRLTLTTRGADSRAIDCRLANGTGGLTYPAAFVAAGAHRFMVRTGTAVSDIFLTLPNVSFGGFYSDISVKAVPGFHAIAPSNATRPLYKTSGGLHWLQTDGVDDWMQVFPTCNLGEVWSHVGGWFDGNPTASRYLFTPTNDFRGAVRSIDIGGTNEYRIRNAADTGTIGITSAVDLAIPHVLTVQKTALTSATGRINSAASLTAAIFDTTALAKGLALFSGRNDSYVSGLLCHFYGGVWIGGKLTENNRMSLEEYIVSITGVTL